MFTTHECFFKHGRGKYCSRACANDARRVPLAQRFQERVNQGGPVIRLELGNCHSWTGATVEGGRGVIWHGRNNVYAARVAWLLRYGRWPEQALHKCDNPNCVRVEHLFEGSCLDNMRDKVAKGRQARGEKMGNAALTNAQALEIKRRLAQGERGSVIARSIGVSKCVVSSIKHGRSWSHIEEPA